MKCNHTLKNDTIKDIEILHHGMTISEILSDRSDIPRIEMIVQFQNRDEMKFKIESEKLTISSVHFIVDKLVEKSSQFPEMTSDQFKQFVEYTMFLSEYPRILAIHRAVNLALDKR